MRRHNIGLADLLNVVFMESNEFAIARTLKSWDWYFSETLAERNTRYIFNITQNGAKTFL